VRFISKRSAKCENNSDLPIFRASSIVSPKVRELSGPYANPGLWGCQTGPARTLHRFAVDWIDMSTATIETFPNPRPEREFEIAIDCPEFTSMCPKTGLPDFGVIRIRYVPDASCLELKSLKYYLLEFRNKGIFYESVTNQILDDLVSACGPRRMTVVGDFTARGGITTKVTAEYSRQSRVGS